MGVERPVDRLLSYGTMALFRGPLISRPIILPAHRVHRALPLHLSLPLFPLAWANRLRRETLGEYFYHNLVGSYDSGQRAVNQILKPGAWAFRPIRHRLPKLDSSIPVHFIYGQNDVMDIAVSLFFFTITAQSIRAKRALFLLCPTL